VRRLSLLGLALTLTACLGIPDGVTPVTGFDADRYLGTWYEIARLDHSFERGLDNVTASYTLRDDGGIDVVNRGRDTESGDWDEATGKAYFVGQPDVGRLKVSFFGPFYGAYNVIALDKADYSYSLVAGPNRSYLWILARSPEPGDAVVDRLVATARELGFPTDELIFVVHDRPGAAPDSPSAAP
jgi:apolipoprotein D and lipocalin family protein